MFSYKVFQAATVTELSDIVYNWLVDRATAKFERFNKAFEKKQLNDTTIIFTPIGYSYDYFFTLIKLSANAIQFKSNWSATGSTITTINLGMYVSSKGGYEMILEHIDTAELFVWGRCLKENNVSVGDAETKITLLSGVSSNGQAQILWINDLYQTSDGGSPSMTFGPLSPIGIEPGEVIVSPIGYSSRIFDGIYNITFKAVEMPPPKGVCTITGLGTFYRTTLGYFVKLG